MKNNHIKTYVSKTLRPLMICIWVFSIHTSANTIKAQNLDQIYLSMAVNNATLSQVIEQIEKQTIFTFFFQDGLLSDADQTITLNVKNIPLKEVLNRIASQFHLDYKQTNNTIALKKKEEDKKIMEPPLEEKPQTGINGSVSDDMGPMPGVNIIVKGTSIGTQTDFDGNYSLTNVPDDAVLVFSYIGFNTQEVPVSGQRTINVTLRQNAQALDEVVVIGYGTRKRKDVTGAVGNANLEDFRNTPVSNVGQLLQGNLPGLNVGTVVSAGSTPSMSVRGRTSISGNQDVLIVLDGIQYNGSLESINPRDIASIDVLKDASSVAVYGAQGANGVILITTKKGKHNQKPMVSISTSYATQEPSENLRPLNRQNYLDHIGKLYYQEAFLGPDFTQPNPDYDLADYIDSSMLDENGEISNTNFNWWDAGTQPGFISEQKVSVSGGSEKTTYLISLDYTNQQGFIVNDKFQRKGARINISTEVTDWWEVGIQSFASFVNKDGAEPNITNLVRTSPLLHPYDEDGNLIPNPANTAVSNPFMPFDVDNYERHDYFFANFFSQINFPFLEGLSYRINFGNNYRINKNYGASEYGSGLTGSAYKNHDFYYDYNFDNIINYKNTFGKHAIDLTLLYGAIERQFEYTGASANGFARLDLGYDSIEQGVNQFTYSDAWREALNYQMARIDYRFDERYLFTATIRRDGFSGFAANNKFGYFPSVAFAWNLHNEDFFKPKWVNNLKLRAGYGTSSNQTSRYSSLARVTTEPGYVFEDGGTTAYRQQLTSLANPNLKWERTTGLNIGLEYGLLKSRLSGSIEYYYTTTNDLLFDVAIPDITGFESIRTNIGEIENQGFEFALRSQNIQSPNFNWQTSFNFSTNTTEVLKLIGRDNDGDGVEDDLTASNLFIGQPLGAIYDYETDGIYQLGDDIPEGYFPGSYRVVDQNGDGEITPADDRVIRGHSNPAYRFSLLNTFKYKGISLRIFINSIQGGKDGYMQNNIYPITLDDNNIRWNYLNGRDLWQPNNPGGIDPVFPGRSPRVSPSVYGDRSFVRLQDVSLSYDFSSEVINSLKMESLQVFISGKNLATWTDWRGWDPETGVGLGSGGRPLLRSYSLGLNVTF